MWPSALFGAQHRGRSKGIEEPGDAELESEWEHHDSGANESAEQDHGRQVASRHTHQR